jgi:uncharacterized membrane protein YphA (DoxX/SURF4 family)
MTASWLVKFSGKARQAHSERLLRLVLGGLIGFAGAVKLLDTQTFFVGLLQLELLDANLAWLVSRVVPVVELVLGVWLLTGWRADWAAVAGFLLLAVFTVVLFSAWWRGLEIDCACFGPMSFGNSYAAWFLRNFLFLLAFLWLFWRVRHARDLPAF